MIPDFIFDVLARIELYRLAGDLPELDYTAALLEVSPGGSATLTAGGLQACTRAWLPDPALSAADPLYPAGLDAAGTGSAEHSVGHLPHTPDTIEL